MPKLPDAGYEQTAVEGADPYEGSGHEPKVIHEAEYAHDQPKHQPRACRLRALAVPSKEESSSLAALTVEFSTSYTCLAVASFGSTAFMTVSGEPVRISFLTSILTHISLRA